MEGLGSLYICIWPGYFSLFSGAGLSALYSSMFAERVDRLVLLDLINIGPAPVNKQVRKTRHAIKASDRQGRLKDCGHVGALG
jgi:hypothetical protein